MKMNVELDDDDLSSLVQEELRDAYEWLKSDFLRETTVPLYTTDMEADRELRFQLIQALRLVHNYFSPHKDRITW